MTNYSKKSGERGDGAPAPPPVLHVAAVALVDDQGRVLLARRPAGKAMAGLWEFPGGKVEEDETPEEALLRELVEELGITILPADLTLVATAAHDYDDFHLHMPLYLCRRWQGTPRAIEAEELAWVAPAAMAEYPMPAADRPLVARVWALI